VSLFLAWVPEANSIISTSGIPFTETFLEFISDDETRKTDHMLATSIVCLERKPTQLTGRSNLEQEIGEFSKVRRFKEIKSNGQTFDLTNYLMFPSSAIE
jgi:hypothetical protein